MKHLYFFVTLLLFIMASFALENIWAQGSGPNRSISSFEVKRTFTGKITAVDLKDGSVLVQDKKGNKYKFYLDEETRFKADKNSELADQKDLSLEHFKMGQTVKVTYRSDGKKVFEVRLRKPEA